MARRCALTGTDTQFGHNVSHSNRKTNRRFSPNIQSVSLHSEALGRDVTLRITTRALRTVTKKGGLDRFLLDTDDRKLPTPALRLKNQVRKRLGGKKVEASA
jgi:large subunit ribosomal protein L28